MASTEAISAFVLSLLPFWFAALAGLLIGWSWRPRWAAALVFLALNSRSRFVWTAPPGLGESRIWFALTALSIFSVLNRFFRRFKTSLKVTEIFSSDHSITNHQDSSSFFAEYEQPRVTDADLETLFSYIEEKDGGPPWQLMMEKATKTLAFQAWRRDIEHGPTQYRTRTVIDNVSPDLLRDFFWDDEFRTTWDDMLVYFRTLQECPHTGTMIVHWIRKFPFFCSDREYIIIRRIWESESTYYCVTKGTPYSAAPRRRKPIRVDLYFSSWRIRAVRNGEERMASEVLLFHYEEMGIPKELAKMGIQRRLWGLVEKMDVGVQAYQLARVNGAPLSHYAFMARINTKIQSCILPLSGSEANKVGERLEQVETGQKPKQRKCMLKWLVVGGVIILCGLNGGAISKGIVFGVVRGLQRVRRRKNDGEVG